MQNFIISLKIPSTISFGIIQTLDKKMEALHFTRVRFAWGADGPVDVATYEGRSDSSADELSSRMRTSIVEGFPEVKMLIEMVA